MEFLSVKLVSMESSRSEKPFLAVRHPLRPFEKIEVKDCCPDCGSVFVTKRECESCGYQFWVDLVGEPFGERSFFEIEFDYSERLNFLERLLPLEYRFSRSKHYRYLRYLRRRFDILVGYFFDGFDEDKKRRKLFLFEAKVLIETFGLEGGEVNFLWKSIEGHEKHPLFAPLVEAIRRANIRQNQEISLIKRLKRLRFFYWLRLSFLIKTFLLSAVVIVLALIFYRYFCLSLST